MRFQFKPADIEPRQSFDVLQPGQYRCRIVRAEGRMANKQETGEMLSLEFEVLEPEYAGRRLWALLCVEHQTDQVRKIAQEQVSAICHAIGKPNASGAEDLLGGDLMVRVKVKPANDKYEARNECVGYKPIDGKTNAAAPAAAPAKNSQPWKR